MIRPPRRFTVLGQTFDVDLLPGDNVPGTWVPGQTGSCYYTLQRVALLAAQHPQQMRDTYLHEMLHALFVNGGLQHLMQCDDEAMVSILTPHLLAMLRDNPRVVEFLTQKDAA